jgi:hypothetical protein
MLCTSKRLIGIKIYSTATLLNSTPSNFTLMRGITLYPSLEESMKNILELLTVHAVKASYYAELQNVFGHLDATRRLDRGYDILTRSADYEISIVSSPPLTFSVKGPNDTYVVIPSQQSCTCPDALNYICKHRWACKLIVAAFRLQQGLALANALED